jgi:hypothetical protein
MAYQLPPDIILNVGAYPNDGTGDDLYTAFKKVKDSFTAISGAFDSISGENVGAGTGVFKPGGGNVLKFKTLTGTGVTITSTADTINLSALTAVQSDTSPMLGGNLNLNSKNITGTGNININGNMTLTSSITASNVQSLVYGIDIRALQAQVDSGGGGSDVDFGTFVEPTPGDQDFGNF